MTCPHCGNSTRKAPLTSKQRRTLDAIAELSAELGYSPTFRQVAERIGVRSANTVCGHVAVLVAKGWLAHTKRSRSMVIA